MFLFQNISLKQTGSLNPLVSDYIEQNPALRPFYSRFPHKEAFTEIVKSNPYQNLNRDVLCDVLLKQSASVSNTSDKTTKNIQQLKNGKTFTITTGHQLCLFTGPLYFIYKIISVINLCEKLKEQFPENNFIPVYWAATEDHDFEEINHLNVFGKTIRWESSQSGAAGDFKTNELSEVFTQLKDIFGNNDNAVYLNTLFENAYLKNNNLALATRYLVNDLFGEYGLVTIDGNNAHLKQQFISQFKKDVFENLAYHKVNDSIKALKDLGYNAQVNPREVNCFYLEEGKRLRIEKEGKLYKLTGTARTFTEKEMNELIEKQPEKISPNVVLRPLYQQIILPNIAYVGGPGELAYWLEYKSMFEAHNAHFPLLIPRSFVTVIDKTTRSKIEKLNLEYGSVFKPEQALIKEFMDSADISFTVENEKKEIEKIFSGLAINIGTIDATLSASVKAELQKALNSLELINGKANRALKQKSETELNQIRNIKEKLFPGGIPQERHDNFTVYYIKWGRDFIYNLKKNINPLALSQLLLIE